jgi:hypothetical protein
MDNIYKHLMFYFIIKWFYKFVDITINPLNYSLNLMCLFSFKIQYYVKKNCMTIYPHLYVKILFYFKINKNSKKI